LGGKGGRCVRLTTLPLSCATVLKSGNHDFLEPSGHGGPLNGFFLFHIPDRIPFLCLKAVFWTPVRGCTNNFANKWVPQNIGWRRGGRPVTYVTDTDSCFFQTSHHYILVKSKIFLQISQNTATAVLRH